MKWRDIALASVLAAMLVLGITLAILLVGAPAWIERHPGTAAWVQAIGVIGTVGATWFASDRQVRGDRRRRREDFIGSCSETIDGVERALAGILTWTDGDGTFGQAREAASRYERSREQDILQKVLDIPIVVWPAIKLYTAMREVQDAANGLRNGLNADLDQGAPTEKTRELGGNFRERLEAFRTVASDVTAR